MRYAEEAIAETTAQVATRSITGTNLVEAIKTGLTFPVANKYVTLPRVVTEGTAVSAKLVASEDQITKAVKP